MLILPREQLEQRVTRNEDMQSFRCQRQTYKIVYDTAISIDKVMHIWDPQCNIFLVVTLSLHRCDYDALYYAL